MKKTTMQFLVSFLNDVIKDGGDDESLIEARDEISTELAKGEAKAQANRDLYAEATPVVLDGLASATAPCTIGELYNAIADELPAGFSKGKVQYLVTRVLTDQIEKHEGKVNTYTLKA